MLSNEPLEPTDEVTVGETAPSPQPSTDPEAPEADALEQAEEVPLGEDDEG